MTDSNRPHLPQFVPGSDPEKDQAEIAKLQTYMAMLRENLAAGEEEMANRVAKFAYGLKPYILAMRSFGNMDDGEIVRAVTDMVLTSLDATEGLSEECRNMGLATTLVVLAEAFGETQQGDPPPSE